MAQTEIWKRSVELPAKVMRFLLACAAIGVVCGFWAFCQGIVSLRRDRPSLVWPSVEGKLAQSDLLWRSKGLGYYRYAQVMYTYRVDGRQYVSHQIALWSPDLSRGNARAFVAANPPRSTVLVYYEPQHPENAVLLPGADEWTNRGRIILGCLMVPASVWLLFVWKKDYARAKWREKSAAISSAESNRGGRGVGSDG